MFYNSSSILDFVVIASHNHIVYLLSPYFSLKKWSRECFHTNITHAIC